MSLFYKLQERVPPTRPLGKVYSANGFRRVVGYSLDFRRIEALPRRNWEVGLDAAKVMLEASLRTGDMELWPVQAAALRDVVLSQGGFFPIGVGQGKALISLLAPVVLEAKRPILFVPAQLRDQTNLYVLPQMRAQWRLHRNLRVIGYSELSLAKNAKILEDIEPDLIILDEAHNVKAVKAGRTRRLVRWFREHPETKCVAMSGTIANRSIKDFAHILQWCLKDKSPLPARWQELTEWSDAIDEGVPEERQADPGALMRFCNPSESVRQGFRRRFVSTPGVVATKEDALGCSLRLVPRQVKTPRAVRDAIFSVREEWETPNQDPIMEAIELWRHVRELALGFWYRWDPPAPKEWMQARRAWKSYVAETLKTNRRNLDTELQVWNECKARPNKEWQEWKAIKDSFKPNSVAEWISDFALIDATNWLKEAEGICWVEHRAFGEALAKMSGCPYFGAGDDSILECREPGIIASIHAHSEGKNLQRYWSNLVVAPSASGKRWEQMLGRTHRHGQQADEVICELYVHEPELLASFGKALGDAKFFEDTFGNRQKLNYADGVDIICRMI